MVLATFHEMQLEGLVPDLISIVSAVSGCSVCKDLILGKSLSMVIVFEEDLSRTLMW